MVDTFNLLWKQRDWVRYNPRRVILLSSSTTESIFFQTQSNSWLDVSNDDQWRDEIEANVARSQIHPIDINTWKIKPLVGKVCCYFETVKPPIVYRLDNRLFLSSFSWLYITHTHFIFLQPCILKSVISITYSLGRKKGPGSGRKWSLRAVPRLFWKKGKVCNAMCFNCAQ